MGTNKIPPGDAPYDERVHPDRVWYQFWYVPRYPLNCLNGKLDKDPAGTQPWIMGLLAAIRQAGYLKNPVIVWNHHPLRGSKQPTWLLRAGSNRVWCAEQLGWTHVPAIVSLDPRDQIRSGIGCLHAEKLLGMPATLIRPDAVQSYFVDGGNIWANEHGFGLLRAKKPEVTYSQYIPTSTELSELKSTDHHLQKIINPISVD